jgi:hypothetical protein
MRRRVPFLPTRSDCPDDVRIPGTLGMALALRTVLGERVWDYACAESVSRLRMGVSARITFSAGGNMVAPILAPEARRAPGVDEVARGLIAAQRRPLFVGCVTTCHASS